MIDRIDKVINKITLLSMFVNSLRVKGVHVGHECMEIKNVLIRMFSPLVRDQKALTSGGVRISERSEHPRRLKIRSAVGGERVEISGVAVYLKNKERSLTLRYTNANTQLRRVI